MEIAQMGDWSAEAGEAKAEENQEHLRGGALLACDCSRWSIASHGSTAPVIRPHGEEGRAPTCCCDGPDVQGARRLEP